MATVITIAALIQQLLPLVGQIPDAVDRIGRLVGLLKSHGQGVDVTAELKAEEAATTSLVADIQADLNGKK